MLPTYFTLDEAALWLAKKSGLPVTIDWVLQYASEGRLPIFALLRKAILIAARGSDLAPDLYQQGQRLPLDAEWARLMLGIQGAPRSVRIHVYSTPTGPAWINDVVDGEREPLDIEIQDLCVRVADVQSLAASTGDDAVRVEAAKEDSVDWSWWASRDLWTVVEASFLFAGEKPVDDMQSVPDSAGAASRIYRDLKDAISLNSFTTVPSRTGAIGNTRATPADLVTWASQKGLTLPSELAILGRKASEGELPTKVRDSLYRMIIGMAIKGFDYDPTANRQTAVPEIVAAIEGVGLSMSETSVRAYLKEAARLLPPPRNPVVKRPK